MLTSDWCAMMRDTCLANNDIVGVKAYSELHSLWKKREGDASTMCVCGKSLSGKCIGLCATGE